MTERLTCRSRELTDDSYIFHVGQNEVRHIAKAYTVSGRTYLIYATGRPGEVEADGVVALATVEEIAEYQREQDRHTVCRALTALGRRIADEQLPVPPGGKGIVLSFDLADDADLGPWSEYLSTRPKRATSRPLVQAEAEGVEVYVYGPGTSGEFGPELAEPASCPNCPPGYDCETGHYMTTADVEHRDAVGASPVVARSEECARCGAIARDLNHVGVCEWCEKDIAGQAMAELDGTRPKPAPVGWPVSDGHRPQVDDEAMKHDRHSGEG